MRPNPAHPRPPAGHIDDVRVEERVVVLGNGLAVLADAGEILVLWRDDAYVVPLSDGQLELLLAASIATPRFDQMEGWEGFVPLEGPPN